MTDLVIRPLEPGESALFLSLPDPGLVGVASIGRDYREFLDKKEYRPEWSWVALRDGEVVARAAWWAGPDDTEPHTLDWFDFTDPSAGEALLRAVPWRTEICLILPAGWRDNPEVRVAAQARIDVATSAGMKPLVERLRYLWKPEDGLPQRTERLVYRLEPDDTVIFDVLRRVHSDTLDAHALRATAEKDLDAAAQEDLDFLHWMPSPREWWRLAYTPEGDLVGITVPGANYGGPVIGIVGVVPEARGHGYGYDLLLEATHLLVEAGATQVVAETDATNTPMAKAFARAGYPITQERVYLV
ncbi:MAG: GNAT family N-acetyltransferase [Micromonosporaceae bacterium]